MSRLLPVVAWLALLVFAVAALTGDVGEVDARSDTERVRVIAAEPEVHFALDPDEERIRIVFWTAAPARWARDVRAWSAFQVNLTVLDHEGTVVWRGEAWRRNRMSWIRRADGVLLRTAWMPQSRLDLSDARASEVEVSGLVPKGGQLVVEAKSGQEGASVWIAAFRHGWRTRAARLRTIAGSGGRKGDLIAAELSGERWSDLPESWRERLSARSWERLSPLPAPGARSYTTAQLVYAVPEHGWQSQPALGLPVPPGGAAAFNLRRGGELRATWRDSSGRRTSASPTWLQTVRVDGTSEVTFLGVVEEVGPIRVDEDLLSVQIALDPQADSSRTLQAHVSGEGDPESYLWGDAPLARVEGDARVMVAPDLRSAEMFRTSADLGSIRFPIEADHEQLRLSFRPRMAAGALPGFGVWWDAEGRASVDVKREELPPVELDLLALGAGDEVLARWQVEAPIVASPFERYTQGDDPGTARVAEPVSRVVLPPAGSVAIEVRASAPTDVAVRVRRPENPARGMGRGYELPASLSPPDPEPVESAFPLWQAGQLRDNPGLSRARYVPLAQDPWQTRAPADRDRLIREDRMIRIDAQVRFEPRGGWLMGEEVVVRAADDEGSREVSRPRDASTRRALRLSGAYQLLVEPDRDGRATLGARSALGRTPSRVTVPASGRLDVDYRIPASRVGSSVVVSVDGDPQPHTLIASAGRLRLSGLTPGSRSVAVDSSDLFLARASGSDLWQVRRVVALRPGQERRIPIPSGAQTLVLYTYGESGWLDWSIQGGAVSPEATLMPRATRRSGRHRLQADGGQARPLSFSGDRIDRLSPLLIEVEEDVGAVASSLVLRLSAESSPVWLRVTSSWARTVAASPSRNTVVNR